MSRLGRNFRRAAAQVPTLVQRAINTLRKYGTDAHVWLPGGTVTTHGPELWNTASVNLTGESTQQSTGVYRVYSSAGSYSGVASGALVVGRTYKIDLNVDSVAVAGAGLQLEGFGNQAVTATVGPKTYTIQASQSANLIKRAGGVTDIQISGISVKEVITTSVTLNGLQANNYLLSDASTGLAPVDQYVGRASDALGGLGVNILGAVWQVSAGASVVSGAVTLNNASDVFAYQDAMTPGATYKVEFAYTITSGASGLYVGTNAGTGENIVSLSALTGSGVFSGVFKAGYARFVFRDSASGCVATFTNISVREVTGIHAAQPTTANKPKLVRRAVNLLTYSNDFTNVNWTKTAGAVANSATQVSLPVLGAKLQQASPIGSSSVGTAWTVAYLLSGTGRVNLFVFDDGGAYPSTALANITLTATPTLYIVNHTHTDATATKIVAQITTGSSAVVDSGGIGAFKGTLTAQQIQALGGIPLTTSATASTALGPWAWQFDDLNDSLALSSAPFQMSDDHCVIAAGVNYASTGDRYLFDGGNTVSSNAMVCSLAINNTQPKVYWRDDAAVNQGVSGVVGSIPIGSAAVISARKRGTSGVLRLNGLQVGVAAAVTPGVTTCTHSAIGVRAVPGNYFNGNIGPVIAIKGTVSDSDLLLLEKLVGALSGVAIP